jgi:diadenosine tetraphosphate (Ap4A) HIT family hydrolase
MGDLRTPEGTAHYKAYIKNGGLEGVCRICEGAAMEEFQYWKVIKNNFPYDKIATTHNMIAPKRHADEHGLSAEEWNELTKIKNGYLHKEYDYLIEATHRKKSIPTHFHLHLIVAKD